jgi:hypothetical protein
MERQRCAMTARRMKNDSRAVWAYGVLFMSGYDACIIMAPIWIIVGRTRLDSVEGGSGRRDP